MEGMSVTYRYLLSIKGGFVFKRRICLIFTILVFLIYVASRAAHYEKHSIPPGLAACVLYHDICLTLMVAFSWTFSEQAAI